MSNEPRTAAGRRMRQLLLDMFQAWQQIEGVDPIEDPLGLILAIEAEAREAAPVEAAEPTDE